MATPRPPAPTNFDPAALPGLIRHLLREGLLTPETAQKAVEGARKAGTQLTSFLVESKLAKAPDIALAVQRNLGLPILDLGAF
ncbi:MAG: hypothetical protein JSR62_16090, partial [Nitrospira sp.]|nr:hypothetical protein [Nitrospira sp.]